MAKFGGMTPDEKFMQRCLDLAKLGQGNVAPNPMVGAVLVHDGKIIGEGFHEQYGEAHAEVNAIANVADKNLLSQATIYVNLEPCAHFGKTPPCSNLIIDSKIPNVVIGCVDSYAEVSGKGIAKMSAAGVNVKVGVLENECLAFNRRFFTFHSKKRPYVILKWAESAEGFIDIDRAKDEKGIFWITQPETKALVHKWRHEEAAILVGKNTVKTDNPQLNCRAFKGNSPIRIVIDQKLHLDYGGFHVGDRSVLTYILTEKEIQGSGNLQFICPAEFSAEGILNCLYQLNIQSVIIEGGKTTLSHFIEENLWDEARILTGANSIKNGVPSPIISGNSKKSYDFGKDRVKILVND